jgi:hypothetical protein
MGITRALVLVSYSVALMAVRYAIADAPLLNMDSPRRVPGEYYVEFKPAAELNRIPRSGAGAPRILPDTRPVSTADLDKLAKALSKSVKAELMELAPGSPRNGFAIRGVTVGGLRELAKDPRIAFIEPVMKVKLN